MNEWQSAEHASSYLKRADGLPHRSAGETALLEEIPLDLRRVLDLGSGDGRLLECVLRARPQATGIALDFSPLMLDQLRTRFGPMSRADIFRTRASRRSSRRRMLLRFGRLAWSI